MTCVSVMKYKINKIIINFNSNRIMACGSVWKWYSMKYKINKF